MGFVAFFGFGLVANICSASNGCYNVPDKWTGYVPTSIKDGNAPAKWMGFVPTWTNDEYSPYGSTTDYNDDDEYFVYGDSTTDYNYDGSNEDSDYDDSTKDFSYDSSNANICRKGGLPPGRQCKKWAEYQKNLAKQQNNQSGNKSDQANVYEEKSDNSSDDDFDFYLDRKRVREEQLQEDEDLKDMDKEAVWGK